MNASRKATKLEIRKMNNLKRAICFYYEIPQDVLFSRKKSSLIIEARQFFQYIAHRELNIVSAIVGAFSSRDHATVLHSAKTIEGYLQVAPKTRHHKKNILKLYKRSPRILMIWDVIIQAFKDILKIITA